MPTLVPLEYCKVVGRFVATVADGVDTDDFPDAVPLQGSITFTPSLRSIKVASAQPDPATVLPTPITVTLDEQGYVSWRGKRGVFLVAPTAATNPVDWNYTVTFDLALGSQRLSYPPFAFDAPVYVPGPDSGQPDVGSTVVDLTVAAPVYPSSGSPITLGPFPVSVSVVADSLVFHMSDGSELPPVHLQALGDLSASVPVVLQARDDVLDLAAVTVASAEFVDQRATEVGVNADAVAAHRAAIDTARTEVDAAAGRAETASDEAVAAKVDAKSARDVAVVARDGAVAAEGGAGAERIAADAAATLAGQHRDAAEGFAAAADASATAADVARIAAEEAAANAQSGAPAGGWLLGQLELPVQELLALAGTALQDVPAATTQVLGGVKLKGDLAGTAESPQIAAGAVGVNELQQGVRDSVARADLAYVKPALGIPGADLATGAVDFGQLSDVEPGTQLPSVRASMDFAQDMKAAYDTYGGWRRVNFTDDVQDDLLSAQTAVQGSANGTPTAFVLWVGTEAEYNATTSNGTAEAPGTVYLRGA